MERTIEIDENGVLRFLESPDLGLGSLGPTQTRRASQVHPEALTKRASFYLLRFLFGEQGRIGNWTRSWRGPWQVDLALSGGPTFGPFQERADAISFEESWLLANNFGAESNG